MGSIVITLVRLSVRLSISPSLNMSETTFFLKFSMKSSISKHKKVKGLKFWKNLGIKGY